ncbi:hypothetical protein DITRI_Ditri04bG0145300 [Diplodiscus trichospermus]
MGEAEMGSVLKQTLKNLCCINGWTYGVFWRFDQRNSMLLTMEDAYSEEQMRPLVDSMLLKFHMLGEGIIGQAAFTGKHQWIFSDSHGKGSDSPGNQNICQDESELQNQFSSGIKTIAIISVERRGVVQFGSTQKILERLEFLDETKKLFYDMGSGNGLNHLDIETCNLDGFFASLPSCGKFVNENLTTEQGGCISEPKGWPCSLKNPTESSCFSREIQDYCMNSVQQNLSHFRSQMQTNSGAAQIISGKFSPVDCWAADIPCTSTWSSEGSILTSFETSLPSERGMWDSPNKLSKKANSLVPSGNAEQNLQFDSTLASFYSTRELVDAELPALDSFGRIAENQLSLGTNDGLLNSVISRQRITQELNSADFTTDLSSSFTLDDLSRWFSPSPQHNINRAGAKMTRDPSCSMEVAPVSSTLIGGDVVIDIPVRQAANSLQSSITADTLVSNAQKSTIFHDNGNDLFNDVGLDFGFGKTGEFLEDIIMPLLHGDNSAVTSRMSESISELDCRSMNGKRKGLFSELGLKELLDGVSNSSYVTECTVEDQFSTTKRTKTESSSSNFHQGQFVSGGSMNLAQHSHNCDKSNNTMFNKEVHQKSQVGVWIDDSYSVNAGHAVVAISEKPTRKRAKPGESTRPRPKDRQLIQDRIKELRGIIPHSGKQLSIDLLLERTIKYLLFLQGITKYADKIKQVDEPKLIGQENGMLPKHNKMSGGATWAFEVGAQSIPIVVKDLNPPGQMLIEMLCEDRGFFLEIADVIRGFGLNILNGVMELQEDKIWARFIVEANEQVERTNIICSLLPLLQQTGTSGIDFASQPSRDVDGGISFLNNYHQLQPPLSMAEPLQ